jgi:protease-4
MLKKFFTVFLGSLAAIWVSAAIFVILSLFLLFALIGSASDANEVTDNSILYIDLSGNINDRAQNRTIKEFVMGDTEAGQNLDEILQAIDFAASDSNIKGIYINCGGSSLGYASREELAAALAKFKKSGKWIYSYADTYSQSDYYVASVATKMYLNPVGNVDVQGLGSSIPFFKNALDKLGVEMQIVKVGTFKSAVEPYILTEASEPSRMQTKVYLDAIWGNITSTIATNRKVTTAQINTWADSLYMLSTGDKLVKNKLVSELKYRREVENILRKLTKLDKDEELRLVSAPDYLASNPQAKIDADNAIKADGHIAVLYAIGEIVEDGNSDIVGSEMVDQIIELADDENVKGLVMRVNSPGGSAFASEQIWEALNYFKSKKKPFYVSMGDYAASGGYYISCNADQIYADANTLTGSIGIFGMIPNFKGLLNDKIGVNISNIQTNPNAVFPSTVQPMTAEQRAAMQRNVENGYKLFTTHVANGRKLPIDTVLSIAEGRVWDGKTALKLHLVDRIGGLDATIAAMAKKLKTDKYNYITYPKVNPSALETIISQAGGIDAKLGIEGLDVKDAKRCLQLLKRVQATTGSIQARMEDVTLY